MPLKIGMLVPNSNFIPFLSKDLPKALEFGLTEQNSIKYELFIEPTGYDVDKNVLADKIQTLIIKDQVDIITTPLNVGLFEHVSGYFSSNQVPLIVNSLGEDVIFQHAQSPYIFINSFNLWQSSWMTGYWGAGEYGQRACSIAGLHDGGYGMGFAFAVGLEAQNGQLLQTAITHRESCTEDPSEFITMIAEYEPDFIFGLYSGKEAVSFLKAYRQLGYAGKIPLVGLPPITAEHLWDELGDQALGIKTISSWDRGTAQSQNFIQVFVTKTRHPVNPYTLLAYETGQLITKAVKEIGGGSPILDYLPEALKTVEFQGLRGLTKFDSESHETDTKDYLQEVVRGEDGMLAYKTIKELETPPLFYEQLALARKKLSKQGWLNPYLIA